MTYETTYDYRLNLENLPVMALKPQPGASLFRAHEMSYEIEQRVMSDVMCNMSVRIVCVLTKSRLSFPVNFEIFTGE